MPNTILKIDNTLARRFWLHRQDMLTTPEASGSSHYSLDTVRRLGMVQLDSINSVVRAHHHILWSRHTAYRQPDYNLLLGKKPSVFEHFSHDAAILPLEIYPFWQRQHKLRASAFKQGIWGKHLASTSVQKRMMAQIEHQGPMCSRDFAHKQSQKADKSLHPWMRPPHKLALDYLWLKGDLCVSHRQGFIKYYDVATGVIPVNYREQVVSTPDQIDFLCRSALHRLGFASASEIQKFYGACKLSEVRQWLNHNENAWIKVQVENANDKWLELYAAADITTDLYKLADASRRLRIVSPFDPVLRDRARLKMLFGMDYRIEIFTPAAKRRYGYYVYPVIEGDRVTARIDVVANRKLGLLQVNNWWLEPGVKSSAARTKRLQSELVRLARLAGVPDVSGIPAPSEHPR